MQSVLSILEINHTLVYFVYGQVFFSLGLAIALHSRRRSRLDLGSHLSWLAAFGLSHGLYEWAHIFIPIQAAYLPASWIDVLGIARICLLALSFLLLARFGVLAALPNPRLRTAATTAFAVLFAGWLVWALPLGDGLDPTASVSASAWARRLFGFPAASLAAVGMLREARSAHSLHTPAIARDFGVAAAAFAAYALLAGLVVPSQDSVVSQVPIYRKAIEFLGLPAPILRSLAGLGVALGIIRGLRVFELETDRRLEGAERERREAAERGRWLRQVITAQEEERRRVARELHDQTGQSLTAVIMALGVARETVARGPRKAATVLEEARDVAVQALEGTRELIMGLRPAALDDLGLTPALRRFVEDLGRKGSLEIAIDLEGLSARLPADVEVLLFRILQESLTNVQRHSGALHASVRVLRLADEVRAEVVDDGAGFDLAEATARPESGRGLGLLGMRERAALLGGDVAVVTAPGKGTRVLVRIPLGNGHGGMREGRLR